MKRMNERVRDHPKQEEMHAKIRLKKIESKTERRIATSTIQQNKMTIGKSRKENLKMQVMFIDATKNRDAQLVRTVLSNLTRHKSVGLSLRNKSIEGAKEDIFEHLHKLQNKMNKLAAAKKDKVERIKSLQQKLQEVKTEHPSLNSGDGLASRSRQLENSLDKIQLKQASVKRIKGLYDVMKERLNNQVINYPVIIKDLEETKANADKESEQLISAHTLARIENDEIQKRREALKEKVENDMRERLKTLRTLRIKLAKRRSDFDSDQQDNEHTATSKMLSKLRNGQKEYTAADLNRIRKRKESIVAINGFTEQAMLVQEMIGVPFYDIDRLVACFVSQSEKTKHLENDITRLKSILFEKTELNRDLRKKFENPAGYFKLKFEEQLAQKERQITMETKAVQENKITLEKRNYILARFQTILQGIFSKMMECARKCGSQLPNEMMNAYDDNLDLAKLLSLVGKALDVINKTALNQTPQKIVEDQDQENRFHRRMEKLVHKNNNRLHFQLQHDEHEKHIFDPEYEGAADDKNYLSRETIKLVMDKIIKIRR